MLTEARSICRPVGVNYLEYWEYGELETIAPITKGHSFSGACLVTPLSRYHMPDSSSWVFDISSPSGDEMEVAVEHRLAGFGTDVQPDVEPRD